MIRETLSNWIVNGNLVQYAAGWVGKATIEGVTAGLIAALLIASADLLSKLELLFSIANTSSYIVLWGIMAAGFYPFVSCTGVPIPADTDGRRAQHEE